MNLKKILLILVSFISFSLFTSCGINQHIFSIFDVEVNSNNVQKDKLDSYLSNNYSYNNLKINSPDILDNAKNITPSKIESFCQIYKFSDCAGIVGLETYLLYNDQFYKLGEGFGGYGVTEFAYIDSPDSKKLYYIYSCGSGIHRSNVGCFNFINETNYIVDIEVELQIDIQFALSSNGTSLDIYSSDLKYNQDRFTMKKNKKDFLYTNIETYELIPCKENCFSRSEWMYSKDKRELIDIINSLIKIPLSIKAFFIKVYE